MEGGVGDRQGFADRDPRELCPLDLSELTPGRRLHPIIVLFVALMAARVLAEVVTPSWLAFVLVLPCTSLIALWRAVRVADSVSVFHRAVDDGWLQAACMVGGSDLWRAPVRPAVLTISHGRVALVGEIAEEWSATEVELQAPPKRWGSGGVMLATPSGPRRLTFADPSDFGSWSSPVVDRQVHTAVARALRANRPPPWE